MILFKSESYPHPNTGLMLFNCVADLDPSDPHMFLGLLDPDPDPLVRGTDPDPSIIMQR
jgi:hypothetical protein